MTTNNIKSCLGYLDKLVDQHNKTYHHAIFKKPVDADDSALTEEIKLSHKAPKCKAGDRVRITKYKDIFSKGYTKNWSREILVIGSVLRTNPWMDKIKTKSHKILCKRNCYWVDY